MLERRQGKARKATAKCTERQEGGEVWPVEITVWVIGRVTAAIDPLIGCLTVSTRLPNPLIQGVSNCVRVCALVFFLCVKMTAICAICSPCLCHQK